MSRIEIPDDIVLSEGSHSTFSDGTCALEAIDWLDRKRRGVRVARGSRPTDHPECVSPVIAAFVRSWNDALPDDAARGRLLRPLLSDMLDTRTTGDDEETRAWMATDWLARVQMPAWLELAGLTELATEVRALAPLVDAASAKAAQTTLKRAREASDAARAAAWDAASDAARAAAWAAASDALTPTVETSQASAQDLVRRMCAVGRGVSQ